MLSVVGARCSHVVFWLRQSGKRLPAKNEPLAYRAFDTLDALDSVLGERCVHLPGGPERLPALKQVVGGPSSHLGGGGAQPGDGVGDKSIRIGRE